MSLASMIHDSGREFSMPIQGAPAGVRIKRNPLHPGFLIAESQNPRTGHLEAQQFSVEGLDSLLRLLCQVEKKLPNEKKRIFLLSSVWEWLTAC